MLYKVSSPTKQQDVHVDVAVRHPVNLCAAQLSLKPIESFRSQAFMQLGSGLAKNTQDINISHNLTVVQVPNQLMEHSPIVRMQKRLAQQRQIQISSP